MQEHTECESRIDATFAHCIHMLHNRLMIDQCVCLLCRKVKEPKKKKHETGDIVQTLFSDKAHFDRQNPNVVHKSPVVEHQIKPSVCACVCVCVCVKK